MYVVSESAERTTRTPAGAMFGLAGPSSGSTEVATWRVEIGAGASTPEHIIDREQVWTLLSGEFEALVDGETAAVQAGQAVVLPAGAVRRLTAVGGPAQALCAMPVGGKAIIPGGTDKLPLPWAE
ncbi:Cupin domain protein [Streptomyces sp. DvalAA-14]|uniref:cupin domain-containing protein n=1 Tax=unclassified Streptomyces TaxID=2593676 RepID=UPI00081B1AD8|nr:MULTISPECIES: cupin domain-containing protein [unclassified Streptomyces]MYS23557.1 cupin domain-containing protein [Streptomyces sp. SID4948]SCE35305.1 Cupin domain protein [Streptomyces sp. DvalAA-14]